MSKKNKKKNKKKTKKKRGKEKKNHQSQNKPKEDGTSTHRPSSRNQVLAELSGFSQLRRIFCPVDSLFFVSTGVVSKW
jgi:hypothetical protein